MDREAWNRRHREKDLAWHLDPNRFLVPEVEGLTPGRALDLAAGAGRNAVWLATRGWSVTAVDWSDVALDRGRRLAEQQAVEVDWVLADLPGMGAAPGPLRPGHRHLPAAPGRGAGPGVAEGCRGGGRGRPPDRDRPRHRQLH